MYLKRNLINELNTLIDKKKSILLLGPRQTGKTTLLSKIKADLSIQLMDYESRQRYEKNPSLLEQEIDTMEKELPIVIIDEIQKVPALMDTLQLIIDAKKAICIITGSSVRKLKNLLPGRVIKLQMDPLTLDECPESYHLDNILLNGTLPGIVTQENTEDAEELLRSYTATYLEEEIRKEALVRQLSNFSQFLDLACLESGKEANLSKLSQEIGISHHTIKDYYSILEDCMIVEQILPLAKSESRKRLSRSPKYLFFDMGLRRIGAKEGLNLSKEKMGQLFESWIGLELKRFQRHYKPESQLYYWRDHNGPEVDWVLKQNETYLPIEVKWTDSPCEKDIRHLNVFMSEYPSSKGIVVCRTPRAVKLSENIIAISYKELIHTLNKT